MLIGPKKPRRGRSALRAVVRDAREAYRRHGGAKPAERPARKGPADAAEPRRPSLAARAQRAASRLSERPSRMAARRAARRTSRAGRDVRPAREPHTPAPDLELEAEATAREMRFRSLPHIAVDAGEIVSVRDNLPAQPRAGVTYRRVRAAMRAARRLRAATDPKAPRTGR